MSAESTPPDGAVEVVRAWFVGEELQCAVRAGVFEEPAMWGSLLADLARYVAQGVQQDDGRDPAATLAAIREAFLAELGDAGAPPP